jgi:hypothetical protein
LETVTLAFPAVNETVWIALLPSLNVTVPVGVVPGSVAVTVAVNVTGWLWTEEICEEANAVVVRVFTVWVKAVEVLVLKLALPL